MAKPRADELEKSISPKATSLTAGTLPDLLTNACRNGCNGGLLHLAADGCVGPWQSYAALRAEALRVLTLLQSHGVAPGRPVILHIAPSADFLATFWACMLGGYVAVPVTPIEDDLASSAVEKLKDLWLRLDRPCIATIGTHCARIAACGIAGTIDINVASSDTAEPYLYPVRPQDSALYLLTSGSTGAPRLVMQTHGSLMSQIAPWRHTCAMTAQDVSLNWLPLTHVGGLVMFHLRDVAAGCRQIQMSTATVMESLWNWLAVMTRHRVTVSWAPHFAYASIAAQEPPTTLGMLNLECVRLLINGGEPIVGRQARAFNQRLAGYQLSPLASRAAWGMSETCSAITLAAPFAASLSTDADEPVSVGKPIGGAQLRVVDDDMQLMPEGAIGQVQICGPMVTQGYYDDELRNQQSFAQQYWFRTGDLGLLQAGELTICGREENLVIIRGAKFSTAQIEAAIAPISGIRAGCVAAFGARLAEDATDRLVVVFAASESGSPAFALLATQIRSVVQSALGFFPDTIVELNARHFPRTDIGKIKRQQLKQQFERGQLRWRDSTQNGVPARPAPPVPIVGDAQIQISRIWSEVLGQPVSSADDDFFELGGQSLQAARVLARVRSRLGVALPLRSLFESRTVRRFAACISAPHFQCSSELDLSTLAVASTPMEGPANAMQQGMLYLHRLGQSVAYHETVAFRLFGLLNREALHASLEFLFARHPALRTCFSVRDGMAWQRVTGRRARMNFEQFEYLSVELRRAAIDAAMQAQVALPFDPEAAPLVRCWLYQQRACEYVLLLVFHHLVIDGWSVRLLLDELAIVYRQLCRRQEPDLPALRADGIEFAIRQHRDAQAEHWGPDLAYWREQLQGLPALDFPLVDHGTAANSPAGVAHFLIARESVMALLDIAAAHHCTMHMVLLSAFTVLLSRWFGQNDLVVGTPVTGRHREEYESVVGCFVNTVAIRARVRREMTFLELLDHVRQTTLDALAHQEVPFTQVVAQLERHGDVSADRNPVYAFSFALHQARNFNVDLEELQAEWLPLSPARAKFPLSLTVLEGEGQQRAWFEYQTHLIDASTVARMTGHFGRLLAALAATPGKPMSQVWMLDAADWECATNGWSTMRRPQTEPQTVHERFESWVAQAGSATAILADGREISYRTLNSCANQVAGRLLAAGCQLSDRVAVLGERAPKMVAALLGVAKAGCTYIPIDGRLPLARIKLMLQDARPAALLADDWILGQLADCRMPTMTLQSCLDVAQEGHCPNPDLAIDPEVALYVMYTSGSTGVPKGVVVPHRAVLGLVTNTNYITVGIDDRIAHGSNVSFDAATFELWSALLNGACLCILEPDVMLSSSALRSRIANERITTLFLTTSLFNAHAANDPSMFCGLRTLLIGGEAADAISVERVLRHAAPVRMLNGYGPTETTTFATVHELHLHEAVNAIQARARLPIGRPIANVRCWILDSELMPVPLGAVGELCIGGSGVALGYFNRPELTAQRFVIAPHDPGRRVYRTGDRARLLPDGTLDLVGRWDEQVKIRGFRVEIAEVEQHLRAQPAVSAARVIAPRDHSGARRLLAFVVGEPGIVESGRLQEQLKAVLPEFMIPAAIVQIDSMPLTANGKLDQLRLIELDQTASAHRPVAECDGIDQRLAELWRSVLGCKSAAPRDNFFELGGHSLLAVQMLSRIEAEFGVALSPSVLLSAPSLHELAERVRQGGVSDVSGCAVAVQARGSQPPLFIVAGYRTSSLELRELARHLGESQPLYALDPMLLNLGAADGGLEQIAAQMVAAILQLQPQGPYAICGYSLGGFYAFEIARQLNALGHRIKLLALLDCFASGEPPTESPLRRAGKHLRALRTLHGAERRHYIATRLTWTLQSCRQLYQRALKRPVEDRVFKTSDLPLAMQQAAAAMLAAWRQYEPTPFAVNATLIRGVRPRAARFRDDDPLMGWGSKALHGVVAHEIDCDHSEMLRPENATALARILAG